LECAEGPVPHTEHSLDTAHCSYLYVFYFLFYSSFPSSFSTSASSAPWL